MSCNQGCGLVPEIAHEKLEPRTMHSRIILLHPIIFRSFPGTEVATPYTNTSYTKQHYDVDSHSIK